MKRIVLLVLALLAMPNLAQAWWNDEWGYRKKITIDTQQLQQAGVKPVAEGLVLVRLHTGNFSFFADLGENGKDLRFMAGDDKTPLKFYIEKIDPLNEMALIWVKLPKDIATAEEPMFWMYYGNPKAVDGQDAPGIFDVAQAVAYHFEAGPIKDATAYVNQPATATQTVVEGGAVGAAAGFDGSQSIRIAATPALPMGVEFGWTVSGWLKIDQAQTNGVVFQRDGLILSVRGQTPVLEVNRKELVSPVDLNLAAWQHLAVAGDKEGFTLYIDGKAVGILPASGAALLGDISIGAAVDGSRGFVGAIDEFGIAKITRDQNYLQFATMLQGQSSALLNYGEDSTPDSEGGGESYLVSTLNNVTIDGWVIIGILGVMFVISTLVMISKGIVLGRTRRENKKFEEAFSHLGAANITNLDHQDEEGQEDFDASPLLLSLTGNHAAFAGSSIYRIYHVGVQEMNKRLPKGVGADAPGHVLTAQGLNAVKASMDGVLVRELQKLNSQMVLLTIAISGGPFLGLLGTVVGVMITFAAIAASGEVNVNAIAPGIAAALVATVAGLAVAIPALFGYNYLGSQIKMVTADMHVFVDEFVAKLAEQHS
ncbi:MAG: flagellar motor protein MotA [Proteobacteria bacterium ST_bin11]|nr:MAG: flagellar motor protein MotA [Proteobacteria bacterium ST_bin11]